MVFKRFSILFILFLFVFVSTIITNIKANELDDEKLIITKIDIDEDFSDDVVVIVLKHNVSLEFIDYTAEDFSEIGCAKVEDLTEHTTKIVKDELEANRTGDFSKLKERIDKNMLVNIDSFHRILCLYLTYPGKENVIASIRKLEKRNDIISAEPDYIEHIDSTPNDLYYLSGDQWGLDNVTGTSGLLKNHKVLLFGLIILESLKLVKEITPKSCIINRNEVNVK